MSEAAEVIVNTDEANNQGVENAQKHNRGAVRYLARQLELTELRAMALESYLVDDQRPNNRALKGALTAIQPLLKDKLSGKIKTPDEIAFGQPHIMLDAILETRLSLEDYGSLPNLGETTEIMRDGFGDEEISVEEILWLQLEGIIALADAAVGKRDKDKTNTFPGLRLIGVEKVNPSGTGDAEATNELILGPPTPTNIPPPELRSGSTDELVLKEQKIATAERIPAPETGSSEVTLEPTIETPALDECQPEQDIAEIAGELHTTEIADDIIRVEHKAPNTEALEALTTKVVAVDEELITEPSSNNKQQINADRAQPEALIAQYVLDGHGSISKLTTLPPSTIRASLRGLIGDQELDEEAQARFRMFHGVLQGTYAGSTIPSSQREVVLKIPLLPWIPRGKCQQGDPDAFYPEKGGSTREAKKICAGCDVRVQCLEYALENDERFGIWGGLSERERRRLKKMAG